MDRLCSPSFGNGELSGSDLVLAHLVKDFALDLAKGRLEAWGHVGSPWGPWIRFRPIRGHPFARPWACATQRGQ